MAIEDEYVAFCLDQAVGYFGRHLESELERAGSDAKNDDEAQWKRKKILSRYFDEEDKPQRGLYADPAAAFK